MSIQTIKETVKQNRVKHGSSYLSRYSADNLEGSLLEKQFSLAMTYYANSKEELLNKFSEMKEGNLVKLLGKVNSNTFIYLYVWEE